MRILFYKWQAIMQDDFIEALQKMGHQLDFIFYAFYNTDKDPFFEKKFRAHLKERDYDAVMSFNYFPLLSDLCEEHNLPYITWVFDSPIPTYRHIENTCNYTFVFDESCLHFLQSIGVQHAYHLPLAVNPARLDAIQPFPEEEHKYENLVSFVGTLYESFSIEKLMPGLPEYYNGLLHGIIDVQQQVYGLDVCTNSIPAPLQKYIADTYKINAYKAGNEMLRQATCQERITILNYLAERFPVSIYTWSQTDCLSPNVRILPSVSYYHDMPLVFRQSKFNLNITLRTIESGIPARALDIMGCGGLLVSNYQPELLQHFTPGEDFLMYENPEDLSSQIAYYTEHEEERQRIARNGYEKTRRYHNYDIRLEQMFDILSQELPVA